MSHQLDLIPEGKAERVLLQAIGFPRPNQGEGIGDTLNKMEHFKNKFVLGLVDNDKRKPALFDRYSTVLKQHHSLELRQKPKSLHFLIVLHPAIETWLIECASECSLLLANYGFSNPKELSRITKDLNVGQNHVFRGFLNALAQSGTSRLSTLKAWIDELRGQHVW